MVRLVLALLTAISLVRIASAADAPVAPMRVMLVGDSTLARGSGYGDALCARFKPEVACVNLAKGGRSSRTYREEGSWGRVMDSLARPEGISQTYVLIQFGHNDQGSSERSTTLPQFTENLAAYIKDVRGAGAIPVLVTPLTRRQFTGGKLVLGLEPWAEAARRVAKENSVVVLDLHEESVKAVRAMGPARSAELAEAPPAPEQKAAALTGTTIEVPKPAPNAEGLRPPPLPVFDYTHVGARGADVFAAMVAGEIRGAIPALARQLSAKPATPWALEPPVIDLWRNAPPGADAVRVQQTVIERSATPDVHDRALIGITQPTLTIYKPAKPDGSAVLIMPGGAYLRVVIDKEGEETA